MILYRSRAKVEKISYKYNRLKSDLQRKLIKPHESNLMSLKEQEDYYYSWTNKEGEVVDVREIDDSYVTNLFRYINRNGLFNRTDFYNYLKERFWKITREEEYDNLMNDYGGFPRDN